MKLGIFLLRAFGIKKNNLKMKFHITTVSSEQQSDIAPGRGERSTKHDHKKCVVHHLLKWVKSVCVIVVPHFALVSSTELELCVEMLKLFCTHTGKYLILWNLWI